MAANRTPKARLATQVSLDAELPRLVAAARDARRLAAADLRDLGIPKAQHPEAFARLAAEGFEPFKGGVRVPLREQVASALAQLGTVPLAKLTAHVAGAAAKDARAAAEQLARDGGARIVLRTKVEVLCATNEPALTAAELASLARASTSLAAQCKKVLASRAVPKTLLREDVQALLSDFVAARPPLVSPAPPPLRGNDGLAAIGFQAAPNPGPVRELIPIVLAEVARQASPVGLTFVPTVVRALSPPHAIDSLQTALLDAARAGRIELRPESGLGRLGDDDLALCPPGPQGTRLSWARIATERPA